MLVAKTGSLKQVLIVDKRLVDSIVDSMEQSKLTLAVMKGARRTAETKTKLEKKIQSKGHSIQSTSHASSHQINTREIAIICNS